MEGLNGLGKFWNSVVVAGGAGKRIGSQPVDGVADRIKSDDLRAV